MTVLRNSDGTPVEFRLDDGRGGVVTGNLDLTSLPAGALVPGTRCSDLSFVVTEVHADPPEPSALDVLRGTV